MTLRKKTFMELSRRMELGLVWSASSTTRYGKRTDGLAWESFVSLTYTTPFIWKMRKILSTKNETWVNSKQLEEEILRPISRDSWVRDFFLFSDNSFIIYFFQIKDMAVAALTINALRSTAVDFSYPFWFEPTGAIIIVSYCTLRNSCHIS